MNETVGIKLTIEETGKTYDEVQSEIQELCNGKPESVALVYPVKAPKPPFTKGKEISVEVEPTRSVVYNPNGKVHSTHESLHEGGKTDVEDTVKSLMRRVTIQRWIAFVALEILPCLVVGMLFALYQ